MTSLPNLPLWVRDCAFCLMTLEELLPVSELQNPTWEVGTRLAPASWWFWRLRICTKHLGRCLTAQRRELGTLAIDRACIWGLALTHTDCEVNA